MAIKHHCKQCGKVFKPKMDKQEDCSEICLCNRFDSYRRKTRKLAKIFAATMGYRSMSEVRFAVQLKSVKLPFKYEKHKFKYQYDPQTYTVDFSIGKTHFEYKGKLMPFNDDCQLFHCRTARKWWLYYAKDNMTGSFSTKAEAMSFYNNGGR